MRTTSEWKEGLQSAERERRGGGHGLGIAGLGSHGGERRADQRAARPPRVTATTNLATCRNPDPVNVRCIRVYGLQKFVRPDRTPKRNFDFRVTGPTRGSPSLSLARCRAGVRRALYAVVTAGHQRRAHPPARRARAHGAILTYGTNNIGASAPAKALVTHSSRLMFLPKRP